MWRIVVVLLMTAIAILLARVVYEAPVLETRFGALQATAPAHSETPAFMYAGIRG
ncbi:MAG: hypothetical protein ACREDO_03015 [Methyloceanibacter sp.]